MLPSRCSCSVRTNLQTVGTEELRVFRHKLIKHVKHRIKICKAHQFWLPLLSFSFPKLWRAGRSHWRSHSSCCHFSGYLGGTGSVDQGAQRGRKLGKEQHQWWRDLSLRSSLSCDRKKKKRKYILQDYLKASFSVPSGFGPWQLAVWEYNVRLTWQLNS